ncbi:ATP-binding protein [Candidatus Woesearchaeota archaeon]|nr:ATP-binding protein [Candidatus Woesearchaeota archaeon]
MSETYNKFSVSFWVFAFLLPVALLYSFLTRNWVNIILSFLILILSLPVFFNKKRVFGGLEFFTLLFLFVTIYVGNLDFFISLFSWWDLFIRFVLGIITVLVAFMIIFILNVGNHDNLRLSPFFISLFCFSFASTSALLWEILKLFLQFNFDFVFFSGSVFREFWNVVVFLLGSFFAASMGFIHMRFFKYSFVKKFVFSLLKKNPSLFRGIVDPVDQLNVLISSGESSTVEFKSALRTNLFTGEHDKRIEHSVLKTIVAFLNSFGGVLLIGVSDEGTILGIDADGFRSSDKFSLHFTNLIEKFIGRSVFSLIRVDFVSVNSLLVCKVEVSRSNKPVFLNYMGSEEFYVRFGPSSIKIFGSKLVDYVKNNFKKH